MSRSRIAAFALSFMAILACLRASAHAELGPGWTLRPLGAGGRSPDLVIHPMTGLPSVTFMIDFSHGGYSTYTGAEWVAVPPPFGFDGNSLALDLTGQVAIVGGGFLHLGQFSQLTCNGWSPVETFCGTAECAQYPSLAFDPTTGEAYVSHFSSFPPGGDLRLSIRRSGGWETLIIDDTVQRTGAYTSLAFDPATNLPCIAYQDVTNLDLRVACFNGSEWARETVDSAGDVGFEASLGFSPVPPHRAGIAYRDSTNSSLKFAKFDGTSWILTPIDCAGDTVSYPSLSFDPVTGEPAIAYHDSTNGALRYAEKVASSWKLSTVDDDTQPDQSLRFDPQRGGPCVAYTMAGGELALACRDLEQSDSCRARGDLNGDRRIDLLDFSVFQRAFRSAGDCCGGLVGAPCSIDYVAVHDQQEPGLTLERVDVDAPERVGPGETVTMSVHWDRYDDCDPDAVIYSSFVGDWEPGEPLQFKGGYFTDCNSTTDSVVFVAPSESGTYRVRWFICYAFNGIRSFCGDHEPGSQADPGVCPFVERTLTVCE